MLSCPLPLLTPPTGTGWGSVSLLKSLNTENYNVVVVSPRNYFLFTPLLPSCTTGLIEHRSIMEPIRTICRSKKGVVTYYEAEATSIDVNRKLVKIRDSSDINGGKNETEVPYDMLVVGVGAENATFGIPGVREHSCFLKEIGDAQQIRKKIMDCVETAAFKDQPPEEIDRLLHMVVVGGGPTGVEFAGELRDFFEDDIRKLVPNIADRFRVTLIEALPNVLPSFSKQLIEYTESTFKEEEIAIHTKTMVKKVTDKAVEAEVSKPDGSKDKVVFPYGLLVWATGNTLRPLVRDLMASIAAQKDSRRGLAVNEYLVVQGARDIWAVGDCAVAGYAPTAQVASQEGNFLARLFNNMARTAELEDRIRTLSSSLNLKPGVDSATVSREIEDAELKLRRIKDIKPFHYSHQGSLAYIGSEKAVADVSWFNGNVASGGTMTYYFWRSAYLSMVFSCMYFLPFKKSFSLPSRANQQLATVYWCSTTGSSPRSLAVTFPGSNSVQRTSRTPFSYYHRLQPFVFEFRVPLCLYRLGFFVVLSCLGFGVASSSISASGLLPARLFFVRYGPEIRHLILDMWWNGSCSAVSRLRVSLVVGA